MPERVMWIVESTQVESGDKRTTPLTSEIEARAYMASAGPGMQLLLRRGVGGPVVDVMTTASGALPAVFVEAAPHTQFQPARNKLEAVSRIARMSGGGPETLGPGSKERKSVLVNLGRALELALDERRTKPELGADLAAALRVAWTASCWSTGSTLTLVGLNTLLEGAEARLGRDEARAGWTVESEAESALEALAAALPPHFDGRTCVEAMRLAEFSQWAQDEWAGFYFEFVGLPALINAMGGSPVKYVNTRFDWALTSAWDLKWHGASGRAPLNDTRAIKACLDHRGLGFIVLSGDVEYDDGAFRAWFKNHRTAHGKRAAGRAFAPTHVRRSKRAFVPRHLEAFHISDRTQLDAALASGSISVLAQGRQASGQTRPPKYSMDLRGARRELRVAERRLTADPVGALPFDLGPTETGA